MPTLLCTKALGNSRASSWVAFQPVLGRARRFANRLAYGRRATPYEVLAEFSDRMSETYATDDVLPRMAQILAQGTGADRASVWLRFSGELRPILARSNPSRRFKIWSVAIPWPFGGNSNTS